VPVERAKEDQVSTLSVRARRGRRPACAPLLVALVLAGLSATARPALAEPVVANGIAGTNGAAVPALDWGPCPAADPLEAELLREYQCATAEVPLSYREPHGQSVKLALGRLPAADPAQRLGTLFWNPGGPGGSGRIPPPFSDELRRRFDLVGFDPRGVADSTPLRCFATNEEAVRLFGWPFPITLAQERRVIELTAAGNRRCAANGGPLLEHMSTANVARDLDLLRQAVGDPQLTYLGFSYGTHLGEVYANLFPDHVRALTLDAVLDPFEWTTGRAPQDAAVPVTYRLGSHVGAYAALQAFLRACRDDERCAFREEGDDLLAKYDRLLERVRRRPVEAVGPNNEPFTITYQDVVGGTLGALYDPIAAPELAAALQDLYVRTEQRRQRAGRRMRSRLMRRPVRPGFALQPVDDEPYFGFEWPPAVICTDSDNPSNPWLWPRYARQADREGPYFGALWVYGSLQCATWPARDADRYAGPWDRPTAHPILLIGNSQGDPATPYEDAVSTSRELASARLLTLDSYGHSAFLQSGCIVRAIERYLVDLQLPPEGTVCRPDRRPFDPVTPAQARERRQLAEALAPEAAP
jgi:pimeloyl-ACP methyl ester carboxylesterase